MIFDKPVYMVYLDGFFVGIAEDEGEGWEIAYEHSIPNVLLDDDVDRVWYDKIDVNRFYADGKNVIDKQSIIKPTLCYNNAEAKETAKKLNKLVIDAEKLKAKIRAMTL